jgi:hypothetical protein
MTGTGYEPFAELVAQIGRMCGQGMSGTVLLVSDDNRMAQLHLHAGQIVFVMCRGRRGSDALGIMRTMRSARLRVEGLTAQGGDQVGLATDAILAYLGGTLTQLPEADAARQPAPRPVAVEIDFLTPQVRLACQQTLSRYIGPMAEIVAQEHFDSAPDARALAVALAAEIPGREAAANFLADIAKVLATGQRA